MREYVKEFGYGAFWGTVLGFVGTGILWVVGSIVLYVI